MDPNDIIDQIIPDEILRNKENSDPFFQSNNFWKIELNNSYNSDDLLADLF